LTKRYLLTQLLSLVIIVMGSSISVVQAQVKAPARTQEYFIQQGANEDLLITISAFEAEFESRISGPNDVVLVVSGIPGSRIVPVFQYVYAAKTARQIDIEITSDLHTGRTEFGIELTRLQPWDSRSTSVSQAYKLLSFGSEYNGVDSQANWTVKIDSLVKAGRLFQQFGMFEMRLWANYLAAHLIYFHLHDHSLVYSMTRDILAGIKGGRSQKVELATLQLQSLALIGLRKSGLVGKTADNSDPVQSVLARTAELAENMGYHFEQARALYASGVEYAEQARYSNALEQFQRAVKIADTVNSAELATAVRESIVQVHTIQGDAPATSEILQEIESQLVEDGGGDDLALNLLAQARLMMDNYRFGEAMGILSGALNYENNSAIRRQINFELARIHFETGRFDEAMTYLSLAGINPDTTGKRRTNPLIDVGEGLRVMANIHRAKGELERMRQARKAQARYQPPADQFNYDQGLDILATAGKSRQQAAEFFSRSQAAADRAGHVDLKHLARLQYCAVPGSEGGLCSRASLKTSYEWLHDAAVPRYSAEAMFLWSQILVLGGQRSSALSVLDQLIDKIHLLRRSLPGVLGAWYWERHELIFDTWLRTLVTASRQGGGSDGLASLLALSKIRYIDGYAGQEMDSGEASAEAGQLREQLNQRANPGGGQAAFALNDRINEGLEKLRASFAKEFEFLSAAGLQKYLRSLDGDEVVLTYHISPAMAQVWIGQKGRVLRRDISNPARVFETLQSTRGELMDTGVAAFKRKMDDLGKYLIEPVADRLTDTVYLIPAGPLLGFPFDALRVKGRYLVEQHNVVNLLSFPANTNPVNSLKTASLQSIFLAGDPRDYSGGYAERLETSAEIRAMADIFVGPGLQIIQGVALLPDEFQGEHFRQSNLVHLTMPALINLNHPGESAFELSESEYEPGRLSLTPESIRYQKMVAALVFMSSGSFRGDTHSSFSSQPGLVSDFLAAGANSVIVNLWPGAVESTEGFVTGFYKRLQDSGNIAESLQMSKLQHLKNNRDNDLQDWAGYQIYIK